MLDIRELPGLDRIIAMEPEKTPVLSILGPTASGKSALAIQLASLLPVEIISADSMQLYKGMDIGTAKPSVEERREVPHHLIDLFDISRPLDVFSYVRLADQALREIRKRGNIPLVAGGSGMYVRALFRGLDPLPSDPALRKILDDKYSSDEGFEKLLDLMSMKDPEDYRNLKHDRRKLIRALEVNTLTGRSMLSLQKAWHGELRFPVKAWILMPHRQELHRRIRQRTDQMLEDGWVEETRRLVDAGLLTSPTARQAIGYHTIARHIQKTITFDKMRSEIIASTANFAKRQISWFKNKHPEAEPIVVPQT